MKDAYQKHLWWLKKTSELLFPWSMISGKKCLIHRVDRNFFYKQCLTTRMVLMDVTNAVIGYNTDQMVGH